MFVALSNHAPKMETRRALVFINMQNDTFGIGIDLKMMDANIVEKAKVIVPAFRKLGDIIWAQTEFPIHMPPNPAAKDLSELSKATNLGLDSYFESSRVRALQKQAASPNADAHNINIDPFELDDKDDSIANYLQRATAGKAPLMYAPGSHGAQIKDDLQPFVDSNVDIQFVKHHHSAFDSTPLLMYLRMKFVTHIYLAGTMSNVSIYSTAADAVRHGFEVSVVEDCLGYRSEARHIEAMGKMADFLGVSGIDSDEIVAEASGGVPPPDADVMMFSGPGMEGIASNHLGDGFKPPPPLFHEPRQKERELSDGRNSISNTNRSAAFGSPQDKTRSPRRSNEPTEHSTPSGGDRSPDTAMKDLPRKGKKEAHLEMGPGDAIGEGDSDIVFNALSPELVRNAFDMVREEAAWQVMHHMTGEVPRRVAVQGDLGENGSVPLYRHPADEAPPLQEFTPTVRAIRDELQTLLKQPFNHVLIQLYRTGNDNISEHSDKTLDVVRGSSIINLSLGAQRNMTLRSKKTPKNKREDGIIPVREAQKVPLPHNSVFVLGWRSNQKWLHGVRADKRPKHEKTDGELAYNGERISLTFRNIGTFLSHDRRRIWGQGARSKWEATAGEVSTTNSAEMETMIHAFGRENQQTDFDWDAEYGKGFDVLNLVATHSTMYLCGDELANMRVKMCALHCDLDCKVTRARPEPQSERRSGATGSNRRTIFALSGDEAPLLREVDPGSSEVEGDLAILFYLNKLYPISSGGGSLSPPSTSSRGSRPSSFAGKSSLQAKRVASNLFARITQANELLFLWQELRGRPLTASTRATHQVRRLSTSDRQLPLPNQQHHRQLPSFNHTHPHPFPPITDPSPSDAFEGELAVWEEYANETEFIAGDGYGIVDCAFWPVLDEITRRWHGWSERRYPNLANYWRKVGALESTRKALAERAEPTGQMRASGPGPGPGIGRPGGPALAVSVGGGDVAMRGM